MTPLGWPVAVYFALAALAAGSGFAACVSVVKTGESRELRLVLLIGMVAIAAGSVALIVDLEKPGEFLSVFSNFNPDSWIARGSRIISAFVLVSVALWIAAWSGAAARGPRTALAVLLGVLALAVAIYPAFVLRQASGRILWQSSLLPAIFVLGALHVGAAIANLSWRVELGLGCLELLLFGGYALRIGGSALAPSTLSYSLIALAAIGAWIAPSILLLKRESRRWHWARVALIVVGALGIRSTILLAGQSFHT